MHWLKLLMLGAAGLGLTWTAQQVALSASPVVIAQADTTTKPQPIEQISEAELEEELRRIETVTDSGAGDELEEFTPTKPLAADLAVALPSDI